MNLEVLCGILALLLVLVGVYLGYRKIRPLYPVKVNCWFCNHDNTVPYGNQNCWDCPHCEQYNGFSTDGDYNKPVPAQFSEHINHPIGCEPSEFLTRRQYLCRSCHRNQVLKVKQLAVFTPFNEETYDDEMAFYKRHLERVYALCSACDAFVTKELNKLDEMLRPEQDLSDQKEALTQNSNQNETVIENSWQQSRGVAWRRHALNLTRLTTSLCSLLLLSESLRPCLTHLLPAWADQETELWGCDGLAVSLAGLLVCLLSKQLLGKDRLLMRDALHILMWLAVLLVRLFHSDLEPMPGSEGAALGLSALLLGLEICVAAKPRQPTNVTTPIIKRLSLDGAGSSARSEAVSSVSTSCRRRLATNLGDHGDSPPQSTFGTSEAQRVYGKRQGASSLWLKPDRQGSNQREMEGIGKDLGAFLIGSSSSGQAGCGKSGGSIFNLNSFGCASTSSECIGGTSFPRPLLSPPRLGVVSFSSSSVSGTKVFSASPSHSMFNPDPQQRSSGVEGHHNLFLAQEPRPTTMFLSKPADNHSGTFPPTPNFFQPYRSRESHLSQAAWDHCCPLYRPKPASSLLFSQLDKPRSTTPIKAASDVGTPSYLPKRSPSTSLLFSPLDKPKPATPTKAASDVDFSLRRSRPKSASLWRNSSSDIYDYRDSESRDLDKLLDFSPAKNAPATVMAECDSTSELSKLKITSSPVKKFDWRGGKYARDETMFSDDEEEDEPDTTFPTNRSSVSTVPFRSKELVLRWLWMIIVAVTFSLLTNIFLACLVWSSS